MYRESVNGSTKPVPSETLRYAFEKSNRADENEPNAQRIIIQDHLHFSSCQLMNSLQLLPVHLPQRKHPSNRKPLSSQ